MGTVPNSTKQIGKKSAKSAESGNEDLTFSESLFSRINVDARLVKRLVLHGEEVAKIFKGE